MPKRKRHPKLPTGWGTIRYLGKGRSRPYAVHPPCTERYENGYYKRPPVLCYVPDWYTGFAVLNAYRAGTYHPGDELSCPPRTMTDAEMDAFCERLLRDRAYTSRLDSVIKERTFRDVYTEWKEWKFGENAPKKLSASIERQAEFSYRHCTSLYGLPMSAIRLQDLQSVLNNCSIKKTGSLQKVYTFIRQICKYAYAHDYIGRDYSTGLVLPLREKEEHGDPFSDEDIQKLWALKKDQTAELLLIMIYSGFRIGELEDLKIEDGCFRGGSKTDAGKNRIVPIHSAIQPLVDARIQRDGKILTWYYRSIRKMMQDFLRRNKMTMHSPHDTRHTFSALCERYGVREADRKRMLGHKVGDLTNDVYGHRTLDDLRAEIEKIKVCPSVSSRPSFL